MEYSIKQESFVGLFVLLDIEVFDLVGFLVLCDHIQEFSQTVLFQVFLGEVLQISLGEWDCTTNTNSRSIFGDFNLISNFSRFTIDFNSLAKILSEVGGDENLVLDWL